MKVAVSAGYDTVSVESKEGMLLIRRNQNELPYPSNVTVTDLSLQ